MRWRALATDYDGTIAKDGKVSDATLASLRQLKGQGVKLVLVTGRTVRCPGNSIDNPKFFGNAGIFDLVVAEDGAVIWNPKTDAVEILGTPVPKELVSALRRRGVDPFWAGLAMISTFETQAKPMREEIARLHLDYVCQTNRNWVMFRSPRTNKGAGLRRALKLLGVSPRDTVGVGDAENDLSFLRICGRSATVGDATPKVKRSVDVVMRNAGPAGTRELIAELTRTDLGRQERQIA